MEAPGDAGRDPRAGARSWAGREPPRRILAIRLQALGDVVVTLPYLQALRRFLPGTGLDFLTRRGDAEIPAGIDLFRRVIRLGGGRLEKPQMLAVLGRLPALWARRYDVVLDLQNNRVSGLVRRLLRPRSWSRFDRFSPCSAGERTRRAIEAAGFPLPRVAAGLRLLNPAAGEAILRAAGRDPARPLVLLNPAGAFPTRNWPLERYARFAALWRERYPAQFAVAGLPALGRKARQLQAWIGPDLLDLTGQTTALEALAIVQSTRLVLSEDSGLMHMAWVSGVPTLALFGGSRSDWSAPLGPHSRCLDAGDLPCGGCVDGVCRTGDVRCLDRWTPENVVRQAEDLLGGIPGEERLIYP